MVKVSIQGKLGSFSHIAAKNLLGDEVEILGRDTFKEVFEDLKEDRCEWILIPIENSTYGSIHSNFDLISEYAFPIVGEVYVKINFHLIGLKGAKFSDIKKVYSHPVAIPQIRGFLDEHPNIEAVEYPDTAGALEMIKDKNLTDTAGAASTYAAELYNMAIIKKSIHDNPKNYTRFFLLKKTNGGDIKLGKDYKTTIEFVLGEESGSLYKCLRSFADRNISLTKIESRPIINTDWEYRFYLDILAHKKDEKMESALNEMKGYVKEFKILGTYEKGKYIET